MGSHCQCLCCQQDSAGAALEQELDSIRHVKPGSYANWGHVIDRVLGCVEGEEGDVGVRGSNVDDAKAVLGHERYVGCVDSLPSATQ